MDGVVLDVDGTLVDTNYQHALAWYLAFRQHDVDLPVWRLHRHIGMGGDQLVAAVAGDDVEAALGDDVRTAHDAIYMTMIQSVSVFAEARELLEDLKRDGIRIVLASSAKQREVDHYLDLLDGRDLADAWTTSDDVETTKPAPDLIEAARAKLGGAGTAKDIIMVGDTPYDIEAAARSGVPTLAVLTGGFSEAELRDAGAAGVFASIADLRARRAETPLAR